MDEVNVLELHQMVQNNRPNKKKEKKKEENTRTNRKSKSRLQEGGASALELS